MTLIMLRMEALLKGYRERNIYIVLPLDVYLFNNKRIILKLVKKIISCVFFYSKGIHLHFTTVHDKFISSFQRGVIHPNNKVVSTRNKKEKSKCSRHKRESQIFRYKHNPTHTFYNTKQFSCC